MAAEEEGVSLVDFSQLLETLSDEQVKQCKEVFAIYDKKELEAIKEEIDPEDTKQIDLEHFLVAFAIKLKETESPEILIDGFKVFDKLNTGFISVAEFRRLMTEIGGQKMELEPVEEMIKVADPDDTGQIVYEPFVRKLLAALAMPPPPPPAPAAKKKKK